MHSTWQSTETARSSIAKVRVEFAHSYRHLIHRLAVADLSKISPRKLVDELKNCRWWNLVEYLPGLAVDQLYNRPAPVAIHYQDKLGVIAKRSICVEDSNSTFQSFKILICRAAIIGSVNVLCRRNSHRETGHIGPLAILG